MTKKIKVINRKEEHQSNKCLYKDCQQIFYTKTEEPDPETCPYCQSKRFKKRELVINKRELIEND